MAFTRAAPAVHIVSANTDPRRRVQVSMFPWSDRRSRVSKKEMPLPTVPRQRRETEPRRAPVPPLTTRPAEVATFIDKYTGKPVYDLAYLLRLRYQMRVALHRAEQASVEWNSLNEQHKARTDDPARLYTNKRSDITHLGPAYDECIFWRGQAQMYAAILGAEMVSWKAFKEANQ